MKTRALLIVAVGLALVAADKPDQKKDDKDAIVGTWGFVSGERDGEQAPDELKTMKLAFKEGDKATLTIKDDTKEAKYKLDAAKKPREIALTVTENGKEETVRGIYELDGDNLKICFPADPAGETPKEFTGKKGSNQMLVVLKRSK